MTDHDELVRLAAEALLGVSHDDGYLAEAEAVVAAIEPVIRSNERLDHGLANGDCVPGDAYRDLAAELASARFVLAERNKEIVWFGEELERRVTVAWDEGALHMHSEADLSQNPYRTEESR